MSAKPTRVFLTEGLVRTSESVLRQRPTSNHEDVVYWAGRECGNDWFMTTCISPEAARTRDSFSTSTTANARVIAYLAAYELALLAQIHTHPDHRVGHSKGDDVGAFMPFEGYLSIVVPHYGHRGILPLEQCGVHQFANGHFYRLLEADITRLLRLMPIGVEFRKQRT